MRNFAFLVTLVLLSACGGGEAEPEVTSADPADLPTLSSVPFEEYGADHIEPPVSYATSPSTGGDHYGFWQNCGYYTEEVAEGGATHTLEHGAVWITYNADAISDLDHIVLKSLAEDNGKLLITPYDQDDTIILSSWGVQQRGVPAPGTPQGKAVIAEFVEAWVDNPALFEAGVSCQGSLGVAPDAPNLFPDGAELPPEYQ